MARVCPLEIVGKVVGNRLSLIEHHPGCKVIPKMAPENRVAFASPEAAEWEGYRPGKDCLAR